MPVSGSFTLAALTISVLSTGALLFGVYQPSLYACVPSSMTSSSGASSVQLASSSSSSATNNTNSTSDATLPPSASILFSVMHHDNMSDVSNSSTSSVSNCDCADPRLCFASTFLHYSTPFDIILAFSAVLLIALLPWTASFGSGGASIAVGLLCVLGGGVSLAGGLLILLDFRQSHTVKRLTRTGYTCGPEAGTYAIITAGSGLLFVLVMFLVRGLGLLCLRARSRSDERRRQAKKLSGDGGRGCGHSRAASATAISTPTPKAHFTPSPLDDGGVIVTDAIPSAVDDVACPKSHGSPPSWDQSDHADSKSESKEEERTSPPPPPPMRLDHV